MVRRSLALSLLAWGLTLGCSRTAAPETETLVLRGFKVVDPASRSVTERELLIENGVIVAQRGPGKTRIIEGKGRWLMPALWDLRSALWGNNSTRSYYELTQT